MSYILGFCETFSTPDFLWIFCLPSGPKWNVFGKPSQTKIASEMEVALYVAYTVDTFDKVYTVNMVYSVDTVYTA